jgi:hypothetical protein
MAGCDSGAPEVAQPDGGAAGTSGSLSWAGVYDADGVWDLSGPINAQRTLGDVVADLLIEEIVARAGVPSAVEANAKSAVRSIVGAKIKAAVDTGAPESLRPDSDLMKRLAQVLASTEVLSRIELSAGAPAGTIGGTEDFTAFKFVHEGQTRTLPVAELVGPAKASLSADWEGDLTAPDRATVDPHAVELRFGKLVLWVLDHVLAVPAAAELAATAASHVGCDAVTAAITDGKPSFTFGVGVASYSVGAASLGAGCSKVAGLIGQKVLGLFDLDAGVEIGGPVEALDANRDLVADRLQSRTGFGGLVTKTRAAIAPRITARFEAARRAAAPN